MLVLLLCWCLFQSVFYVLCFFLVFSLLCFICFSVLSFFRFFFFLLRRPALLWCAASLLWAAQKGYQLLGDAVEGERDEEKDQKGEGQRVLDTEGARHGRTPDQNALPLFLLTRRFAVSGCCPSYLLVYFPLSSRYSSFFTFSLLCFICFSVLSFFPFFFFLCCFLLVFFCFFFSPFGPFDPDQSRPGQGRTCQSRTKSLAPQILSPFFWTLPKQKTAQSRSLPSGWLQCGHGLTCRPFEDGVRVSWLPLLRFLVTWWCGLRSFKLVR